MKISPKVDTEYPIWAILLVLLIVPIVFYWRNDLFFMWDDWTELDLIAHNTFSNYLTKPNGEIFFPFFHLIFYILLKLTGEKYGVLVMINCLATGLGAFLLYLFFKKHFSFNFALGLSILYAGSVAQQAIVWNAFYLCYILSLLLFISALLLTIRYMKASSNIALFGIGTCAWLSIHSHNYTVLAILFLPLYVLFMEGFIALKKAIYLGIVVGIVITSFIFEYLAFAGIHAMTFFNHDIFIAMPDITFISYWLVGAFLSPAYFLFAGHLKNPLLAIIIGSLVLFNCIIVILLKGNSHEKRLTFWALLLNCIPFLLNSFGRYTFSFEYALSARYVFFTLFGTLLVVGTSVTILCKKVAMGAWPRLLPLVLMLLMILGQIFSTPLWQKDYLNLSRIAFECYQKPDTFIEKGAYISNPFHPIGQNQIYGIKLFFKNKLWF